MKTPREVAEEYMRESVAGCYTGDLDLLTSIIADVRNETLNEAAEICDDLCHEIYSSECEVCESARRIRALKGTNHGT